MGTSPWLYLSTRRSSIRAPLSSLRLQFLFVRSNSSISDEFTVCGGGRRLEEVPFSSLVSRLIHSSTHHHRRQIDVSLGIRCFSSGSFDSNNEEIESECDNVEEDDEIEVDSSADPEEVERVCKVIDELFALDRNMEAVLDQMKLDLSHDLIVEVLERFRHARKPAFRFFRWAAEKQGYVHDSRTYNSMMSILAKTRQFETMVSVLEEMGAKGVLTKETFSIAMKAFAAAKERKKAVGIFYYILRP